MGCLKRYSFGHHIALGAAYPAYRTFKVLKSKDAKLYGKWMVYWIAFACFTCGEPFGDVLFGWLSFYYWFKIIFVLWLLSPVTRGSTILYRKFIRPFLKRKETEIDGYVLNIKRAVFPFVYAPSSTTSLDSCCSEDWESQENTMPVGRCENKVEIAKFEEEGFDQLLSNIRKAANFWTSNIHSNNGGDLCEDADPLQVDVTVKYKSGTAKMLVRRSNSAYGPENKFRMYFK